MEHLTNLQVAGFLKDFEKNSKTIILEEGQEKTELEKVAEAKGMQIKNSKDLAVFKTIYAFTDKPNANGAILPKAELLRVLPQIIGKPININHDRRYVVGHYIDYRYKAKEKQVIAYGVFYKSNFEREFEDAKKLFKKKKLSSSFEIWSAKDKREDLGNGIYKMYQMEISGGALIYEDKNNKPAFKDAKMLNFAKENKIGNVELVYASKYKLEEIITSQDYFKDSVKENFKKLQDKKKEAPKPESKPPVTEPKPEEKPNEPIASKIKCSNCEHEWELGTQQENGMGQEKCPKCFAILDNHGKMIYPPQIKDFKISCPACQISNWLILSKKEDNLKLKCLSCSKEYKATFAKEEDTLAKTFNFIYMGSVSCYQCGKRIELAGTSQVKNYKITCPKCGLEFSHDTSRKQYKKISKLTEIDNTIEKSSEKGGQQMTEKKVEKVPENKIEVSKYHRSVEDFEVLELSLEKVDELVEPEKAKVLTAEQKNALPDNMFAVVVRVKDKRTGKLRKIRKYPINDEAHVRNAMVRLALPAAQATLNKLVVNVEATRKKVLKRAKQLNMTQLLERHKKASKTNKAALPKEVTNCVKNKTSAGMKPTDAVKECWIEYKKTKPVEKAKETPKAEEKTIEEAKVEGTEISKETLLKAAIRKQAKKIISLKKEIKQGKENFESKLEFYKANSEEINERREALKDFGKNLTDVEILDDDKYAQSLADKENSLIESSTTVGDKAKGNDYWKKIHAKVDKLAFGRK